MTIDQLKQQGYRCTRVRRDPMVESPFARECYHIIYNAAGEQVARAASAVQAWDNLMRKITRENSRNGN